MTKKHLFVVLLLVSCISLGAWSDYVDDWGPALGAPLAKLEANDHSGVSRNLDNLAGEQGLLLLLSRSADW